MHGILLNMIVKRLIPGQDLKRSLEEIRDENGLKSGVIICMVGSLDNAVLRMADETKKLIKGPLEIVSATGTIATNGVHVHMAVADAEGKLTGGHLIHGSLVQTTIELCILSPEMVFERVSDPETGYNELVILDD
jgi:uncharacterized protein